jgi:hypothetical protein
MRFEDKLWVCGVIIMLIGMALLVVSLVKFLYIGFFVALLGAALALIAHSALVEYLSDLWNRR